jgi:predicted RNase H-related nuclease YkuK (DUF458 family)
MKTFKNSKVIDYLKSTGPDSKIYLGCDSQRRKRKGVWYAVYTVALVVHIDGSKGCKIFYIMSQERDFDNKLEKPTMRLMNETMKAVEAYIEIEPYLGDRYREIHLDVNPKLDAGSNHVMKQAMGYVKGVCMIDPKIKPLAFAASKAADHGARLKFDHQKDEEQVA